MMHRISRIISKWLLSAGAISSNDQEIYEYAVYSVLFSLIPLILVFIIGSFLGMAIEGILFLLPFLLIRKFSGGFHLKSSVVCFVSSISVLTIFLLIIRELISRQSIFPFSLFVIGAVILLICLSPIDSEERRLSIKERVVFKKIAVVLSVMIAILYFIFSVCNLLSIAIPLGAGLILSALLQFPCAISKIGILKHKTGLKE